MLGSLPWERGQNLTRPLVTQLKYKLMRITVHAALQRQFHSPFIFREEDPSRQVSTGNSADLGPGQVSLGKGSPFAESFPTPPAGERWTGLPAVSAASEARENRDKQAVRGKTGENRARNRHWCCPSGAPSAAPQQPLEAKKERHLCVLH